MGLCKGLQGVGVFVSAGKGSRVIHCRLMEQPLKAPSPTGSIPHRLLLNCPNFLKHAWIRLFDFRFVVLCALFRGVVWVSCKQSGLTLRLGFLTPLPPALCHESWLGMGQPQ